MSAGLDLSDLTDDQLVELARHVAAEIGRRSQDVEAAAMGATLDEREKIQIARKAAEAEAARLRQAERERVAAEAAESVRRRSGAAASAIPDPTRAQWAKNKAIGLMVTETLGEGWKVHCWRRDGDRRIYLDGPDEAKISYYVTGSDTDPPGTLRIKGLGAVDRDRIKAIAVFAARSWKHHLPFSAAEAAEASVDPAPMPADYLSRRDHGARP